MLNISSFNFVNYTCRKFPYIDGSEKSCGSKRNYILIMMNYSVCIWGGLGENPSSRPGEPAHMSAGGLLGDSPTQLWLLLANLWPTLHSQ